MGDCRFRVFDDVADWCAYLGFGGAVMRFAWFLVIAGAAMAFTPGILDPVNMPVNGLTLLGVTTMVGGAIRAAYTV